MAFRPDRDGTHRAEFDRNKKKILATQTICGICGKPVEKNKYKYPHPLSPAIDHIVPVAKGGHPSALSNLQLAHMCCNREKSDKLTKNAVNGIKEDSKVASNRILPQSCDWTAYKAK